MWITTIHITLLEIKMEKFKNIYVLSKITKIRPILVGKIIFLWHLNVFSMRRKNSVSRVVFTLLHISFMSGFNSRQVDSHICFCIHLLQNVHGILVREWEWKRQILSQDDYESSFDHVDLLKRPEGFPKAPRPYFEGRWSKPSPREPTTSEFYSSVFISSNELNRWKCLLPSIDV